MRTLYLLLANEGTLLYFTRLYSLIHNKLPLSSIDNTSLPRHHILSKITSNNYVDNDMDSLYYLVKRIIS